MTPPSRAILLVESDTECGRALARLLRRNGHHVRLTRTARAALAAAERETFDMAVVDLLVPGGGVDLGRVRLKLPARQLLRRRGEEARGQKLLMASVNHRPAVFFSEFDLSAAMAGIENYRSLGYKPDAARKIVGNLAAFAMAD